MPDYRRIIDAQTWDFIERTTRCYPEDTATRTVAEQRAIYDAMCRAFHVPHPKGVTAKDRKVQALHLRDYLPETGEGAARILFFHGGGFVVGGLESHDDLCAEICAACGFALTAVDYRLAPEHRFPADLEDALSAWHDLCAAWPGRIVLVGDSAGAALCAGLSHALRDAPRRPDGQVLIYPGLGFSPDSPSMLEHAFAPMLSREDCLFYRDMRIGENPAFLDDPRCCPLRAQSFANLPPTFAFAAECDPLADEARAYADAIRAAGGTARSLCEPGLVHGYLRARHSVTRARDSFARIVSAIGDLGTG